MNYKYRICKRIKTFLKCIFNCDNLNMISCISDDNIYKIEINNKRYYFVGEESIKI